MIKSLFVSIRALVVFTILFGVLYPASVTLLTKFVFSDDAKGSIIFDKEKAVGSVWIGQENHNARYFWSRPSATIPPYNPSASNSSNTSINAPEYKELMATRVTELQKANPTFKDNIPADMVTASASGLDPHITPAAANMQVARVANARGMKEDKLQSLVDQFTDDKQFTVLGRPRVNVLELNIALDAVEKSR